MSSAAVLCAECGTSCQRKLWTFWNTGEYNCEGDACHAKLCSTCINVHPLISNKDLTTIHKYCTSCFQKTSLLDFTRTYDIIDDDGNSSSSGITFVFVHGGCGSRAMFRAHAVELNQKYGHRSVLLDLPGHGTLVDTPLSIESCKATLQKVLDETNISTNKSKPIFVGGSLGAYIGFYLIHEFKDYFSGAILIDCGQNVGPGASLKAKMGLIFLEMLGKMCTNATMLKMMADTSKKSQANYHLFDTCYGAGMYFDQVGAQVTCLKAIAPAEYIPQVDFPILFLNGSEDYRDSEDLWLSFCADQERSELKVYEGGDHFFTHDERFVQDILERMDAFANKATKSSEM